MSTATEIGRDVLGTRMYKNVIQYLYGVPTGNVNLYVEYNRYMVIKALEEDELDPYYTDAQRRCLEGIIKRPARTCNC